MFFCTVSIVSGSSRMKVGSSVTFLEKMATFARYIAILVFLVYNSSVIFCFVSTMNAKIQEIATIASNLGGLKILEGSISIDLQADVVSKIGSRDIVTKTDKEVQDSIKLTILSKYPEHRFLGEEDVPPGIDASRAAIEDFLKSADHFWICDPIDGTTNFAHGMPLSGIILAFVSNGELVYGHIHDPFRNETFTAYKGQGSYLNGRRIKCCETSDLKNAVVCTGSPPNFSALNACLRATNSLSKDVRTMRMLGSASIMLSWLAVGRVTAYFETDLNVWDLAAGSLIIQEAGGRVTDVWGKPYELTTRNLVASNGRIHDELVSRLYGTRMWME